MFRGIHQVSVDAKGRLALPARLREEFEQYDDSGVVVTIDPMSRCLLLYPVQEWEQIQEKLDRLPTFQPQARRLQRLLVGHATDLELDSAGRLLLPAPLREFAKIERKSTLLGQGKKIEIWGLEEWEAQRDEYLSQAALENLELDSMMDISL